MENTTDGDRKEEGSIDLIMECRNISEIERIVETIGPRLPYHNPGHMKEVTRACGNYGVMEHVSPESVANLMLAGALHDVVYIPGRKDNEELSAEVAKNILYGMSYEERRVNEVARLIVATKFPTHASDHLEQIICDADLDNLGSDDYFRQGENLRVEFGVDRDSWYQKVQPDFLQNVKYYTPSAQQLRGDGVKKNLTEILAGKRWEQ